MTIEEVKVETAAAREELEACYKVVPTDYEEMGKLRERFDLANLRLEMLRRTLDTYNFETEIKLAELNAANLATESALNNTL